MARWKNINGVLQKIAGSVRIDQVLNKLSRNAISNKAVSEKFETVDAAIEANADDIDAIKSVITDLKTNTNVYRVCPPQAISLTAGQQNIDLCNLTLGAGRWLIIGHGLVKGDLMLIGERVAGIHGRNYNPANAGESSTRCYGFVYVPQGSTTIVTLRMVTVIYNCTAHADATYCGLFAIRLT